MGSGFEQVDSTRLGRPRDQSLTARRTDEILAAAATLFARRGYSNTTTQELADLLQVGKGTIYRYFPTKEDLFLATVDRLMQQLTAAIDTSTEAIEEPVQRIQAAVLAYLTFFAEHPEATELLIQERAQFKDRQQPTYFVYRAADFKRRREQVQAMADAGRLRDMPAERMMEVIGDVLYGTMFTNYFTGRHRSPEEQARDILEVLLLGILSDSERQQFPAPPGDAPSGPPPFG